MFWFMLEVIFLPISKNVTGFAFHASSLGIRRKLWGPNYFVLLEWNSQCCALCKVFFYPLIFRFPVFFQRYLSAWPRSLQPFPWQHLCWSSSQVCTESCSILGIYSNFKSFYFFCHNCGRTFFKQVSFIYLICTPVSGTANIKASLLFVCHTQIHSGKSLLLAIF